MDNYKRTEQAPAAHAFDILAIIFVALLVTTSFVAFTYWSKFETAKQKWARATHTVEEKVNFRNSEDTIDSLGTKRDEKMEELQKLSRVLGFYRGEDASTNVESALTLLNEVNDDFELKKQSASAKDLAKQTGILTVNAAVASLEGRIDKLVNDGSEGTKALEKKLDALQGQYKDASETGKIGAEREKTEAKLKALQASLDAVLAKVKDARSAKERTNKSLIERRDSALDAVLRARQQKQKVENELHEVKLHYKEKVEELKDTHKNVMEGVVSLEGVIRKIVKTNADKDPSRPDGEILSSNPSMQVAWISLTRSERLMQGMRFEVFRYRKGGKEVIRGEVQVLKVGERMSKVRILKRIYKGKAYTLADMQRAPAYVQRDFKIDPFGQGDKIRNEDFDKREKRVFVFAGKMTGPPNAKARYEAEEMTKLIEELGDSVHRRVDEQTSYVVLGEGYQEDPNFKKAEELGIPKMSERALMEALGKY